MPSVVIGKVKGDKGDAGVSPIVTLSKENATLTISVTDSEGTKTETINTEENVQSDWNTTDTALDSYIKNKPDIPTKLSELINDAGYQTENTTYTLSKVNNNIKLIGSDGSEITVADNTYVHPTYSSEVSGFYKVTVDNGHISAVESVTKEDITSLGLLYAASSTVGGSATQAISDESGNNIKASYASSISISDRTITLKNKNGTSLGTVTVPADSVSFTQSLTSGTKVGSITINGTTTDLYCQTNSDTKNTAGSTNTSSKIFLVGATSQAANPQTYSHDTAYVGTNGCLYSNNKLVTTTVYSSTEPTSNLDTGTIWIG